MLQKYYFDVVWNGLIIDTKAWKIWVLTITLWKNIEHSMRIWGITKLYIRRKRRSSTLRIDYLIWNVFKTVTFFFNVMFLNITIWVWLFGLFQVHFSTLKQVPSPFSFEKLRTRIVGNAFFADSLTSVRFFYAFFPLK